MKILIKKESLHNNLILLSIFITLSVFIGLFLIFLTQPKLQPIDMNRWLYEEKFDYYYQNEIIYYNNFIDVTKATLSIYYPSNFLTCKNEYKYYKCKFKKNNKKRHIIAMFLLDNNENIAKKHIKEYIDLNIIVIKPNFHNPYKNYDILLSISEIKASIKYVLANLKNKKLFVIGYGIFGEICNILGVSVNSENFTETLNKLETEDKKEKINGIISIMPFGGFDIGDSGFEWVIKEKRNFPKKKIEFCENFSYIQKLLINNYEIYLMKNFFKDQNETLKNFIENYRKNFKNIYKLNEIAVKNDSFPIYDEIASEKLLKNMGNKLFGNFEKEKPQHFDYFLSKLAQINCIGLKYSDFSNKNNFMENLNITERVQLSSPLFYLQNYSNFNKNELPKFWKIFSDKNFIKNNHFPNEYNLYLKLNDLINFDTSYSSTQQLLENFTFHNLTLMTFKEIKNKTKDKNDTI